MIALAAATVALTLLVIWRVQRQPPEASAAADILLLRPADQLTPAEKELLARPLDYAGKVEHVLVGSVDPGVAGVRFLRSTAAGFNRKLTHIKHALRSIHVGNRSVVIADADVKVDGALLQTLTAARADVVVAPPWPAAGSTLGSLAARAALTHTLHNFRALLSISKAVCGKAIALSPAAQAALLSLDDVVAEDLRLAESVQSIVVARGAARTLASPALPRFLRWMQILRAHRPLAYWTFPLFIAPLPLLLLAPWWAFAGAFATRAVLALVLEPRGAALFWLGEPLLLLAWIASLFKRQIRWRDQLLCVAPGGLITAALSTTPAQSKSRRT